MTIKKFIVFVLLFNLIDCLLVLLIGGEWLLLQWNKTRIFILASGSLLKDIQPLTKTPEQHRLRFDPTFQWAVSVFPITDNSPRFFIRSASQTSFQLSKTTEGFKKENVNTLIKNELENKWKVLQSVEQSKQDLSIANADTFIFIEDGDDQPNVIYNKIHSKDHKEQLRKKKSISLFESINVIRHLTFTTAMQLEPFPIRKKPYIMHTFPFAAPLGRERDGEVTGHGLNEMERSGRIQLPEFISSKVQSLNNKYNLTQEINYEQSQKTNSETDESNLSCITAIALIDQQAAISVYSLLFDFDHHRISLHSFVLIALPSSSSRLMPILDKNRVMKVLKGENIKLIKRIDVGNANIVKGTFIKNE
ncbi:MAG: hypothetical protein EZS28_008598 [Streblomastix strix]|uniref:Uncharacterized protein n=1 Tax=Streblomastix strix TaxID=222440 RepID=A0A5J4WLD4_9EUKA|nr:MAG: hypothetical protein EZS28_008598 [Streblomastix strix]